MLPQAVSVAAPAKDDAGMGSRRAGSSRSTTKAGCHPDDGQTAIPVLNERWRPFEQALAFARTLGRFSEHVGPNNIPALLPPMPMGNIWVSTFG